ncbi:MAG: EAL domain-containing protein [Acidimicrobiales bacterium]
MGEPSLLARVADVDRQGNRERKVLWGVYAAAVCLLLAYLVILLSRPNGAYWTWLDGWMVCAFECALSLMCIARGLDRKPGSGAILALGVSLLSWSIGDICLTVESLGGATPPTPSLADAFYLAFYPCAYIGLALLMKRGIKRISSPSYLDGAVAGLGAATLCAAFAFHEVAKTAGGSALSVVVNLAYPIGDVLLLALIVAGTTLLSGRGRGPWALIAFGIAFNVVGDTFNLFSSTVGDSRVGITFNAMAWPVSILLISLSVWIRPKPRPASVAQKTSSFVLPGLSGVAALAVLLVASVRTIDRVAIALAAATLAVAGVRLVMSTRGLRLLTEERHRQAITDDLTGLGNRRHLFNVFSDVFDSDTHTPDVAFLFVDLDHFKEINDSFGHATGDELLRQLGPRLTSAVRKTDVVVRLGGDEFAILLMGADSEEAKRVAERITHNIEETFILDKVRARIGASIGISMLETDATDSASLLQCADIAMFRAKSGNSDFEFYDVALDSENVVLIADELRVAIEEGQFELHYQPQLNLRSGEICAVEALLRWDNPRLGMVPPLKFLPLAEEAGLMPALTALVLDDALGQCAMWREQGHDIVVSVNLSASNLLDRGFTHLVKELLNRYRVPPEALVLEITETCIISDYERARSVIEALHDAGLVISIDDFGAGFTSLAYLGDLAVGELKLDRIFVTGLGAEDRSRDLALIRSTIELAHALRLRVVAEGIEDGATLQLLSSLGCDVAQGYFIGRPVPAADISLQTPDAVLELALVG